MTYTNIVRQLKQYLKILIIKWKSPLLLLVVIILLLLTPIEFRALPSKPPTQKSDVIISTPIVLTSEILQFGLKSDKLSLLIPIIKNVNGDDKTAYNQALKTGVAHYRGTALPDEEGNVFIFGHSSAINDNGPYSKIFASLNKLEKNDIVVVYFESKEYNYKVTDKKVVENNDFAVLNPTTKKTLTLMTCWPIGTNLQRLIVRAQLMK